MQTNLNPEELNAQFRLAEQGDSNAQYQMGNYYVNLASDAENYSEMYDKARDWYYKSAKQGNLKAQNALGGLSLPGGDKERFYWVKKAADGGLPVACASLGNFYYQGCGVKPNERMAEYYFRKGAELGDEYCKMTLLTEFEIPNTENQFGGNSSEESDRNTLICIIYCILIGIFIYFWKK